MTSAWPGLAPVVAAAAFAALAHLRPRWICPLALALVPWQGRVLPACEIATLAVIGGGLARGREILRFAREQPRTVAALAGLPLWILLSVLWARQPAFVFELLAKWLLLVLAALLAASDDYEDPRPWVVGALLAVVPASLWACGERLRLIEPRGDPRALEAQLIQVGDAVRGRALFHHPNKLAEFLEQVGLWLAGAGLGGIARPLCLLGFAIAAAGVWGTGSLGGLGVILAGGLLLAALTALPRLARRLLPWALPAVAIAVLGVLWFAYTSHGGLSSRTIVYRFALDLISKEPWLGLGGGHWSLAVGSAPLGVSRYWFQSHPHSLPLMILAELGVIGLALAVCFFAVPLWQAIRSLPALSSTRRAVAIGAVAGVLGLNAHGLVNYFLKYPVNGIATGLLLGVALGATRVRRAA